MTQSSAPTGELTLNGRTYTLKFNFTAIAALERHLKAPIAKLSRRWQTKDENGDSVITLDDLVAIIWAGLQPNYPGTKVEKVFAELDAAMDAGAALETVMSEAFAAFNNSSDRPGDEVAAENPQTTPDATSS